MSTLTISLAEFDQIRAEKQKALDLVESGKKEMVDLQGKIREVEASKMAVERVKTVYKTGSKLSFNNIIRVVEEATMWSIDGRIDPYSIAKRIEQDLAPYDMCMKMDHEEVTFINVSDLKEELRKEVESSVQTEIVELRASKKEQAESLKEAQRKHQKAQDKMREEFDERSEETLKAYQKLQDDLDACKNDKDTRSQVQKLENKVEKLAEALSQEMDRTWWDKITGKGKVNDSILDDVPYEVAM